MERKLALIIISLLIIFSCKEVSETDLPYDVSFEVITTTSADCDHGGKITQFGKDFDGDDIIDKVDTELKLCNSSDAPIIVSAGKYDIEDCQKEMIGFSIAYDYNNNDKMDELEFPVSFRFCQEEYDGNLLFSKWKYIENTHCEYEYEKIRMGFDINKNNQLDYEEILFNESLWTISDRTFKINISPITSDYEDMANFASKSNPAGSASMKMYGNFDLSLWSNSEIEELIAYILLKNYEKIDCIRYKVSYAIWDSAPGYKMIEFYFDANVDRFILV